ncbi:MAG: peptidoglycan DD-metalloendopeptidase family protein [Cyanobacteria bacterium J06632_3]
MTAPQHDASPKADQASTTQGSAALDGSRPEGYAPDKEVGQLSQRQRHQRQKLQRCWFITLGLLGGFGFVASQMSLAIAQTDFLITDYSANSGSAAASNHTVADTTFTLEQPAFEVAQANQPMPLPEAFIEAPANPSATVAALTVTPEPVVAPAPAAPAVIHQPVVAPPQPVAPQPVVQQSITQTSTAPSAAPSIVNEVIAAPAQAQALANTEEARIDIEITPAAVPTVAPVQLPRFTSDFTAPPKRTAAKPTSRAHLLTGLIEASAVAAPISAYAADSNTGTNAASLNRATLLANAAGIVTEDVAPAPEAVPDILPAPVEAAPPIVEAAPVAEEAPIQATEIVPAALPEGTNLPEEYNSIFVDPTDYSVGATEATQTPDVVVSEQSTGCEFTVGQGQAVPNGACGTGLPAAPAPVAEVNGQQNAPVANVPVPQVPTPQAQTAPVASAPAVNVGPVTFSASGIRLSTSAAGREYINRTVRPLVNLQAAQNFIFPLSIPSPITSLFGYRIHPIFGDRRFHAGTDIGAAQGTPVLAAQDGVIASAGSAGGYGLMVVIHHDVEDTQLESRYAHLAEIFVDSGREVKKGDVIGLVGSTGNSTGPHLHFEMRQMTADGWVLVNADGLVQASLANLIKALNSPMESLSFNLSDFNLSNLRARNSLNGSNLRTTPLTPSAGQELLPGQNGIPFRPAQPNAS